MAVFPMKEPTIYGPVRYEWLSINSHKLGDLYPSTTPIENIYPDIPRTDMVII
jgi:hypothetical protein